MKTNEIELMSSQIVERELLELEAKVIDARKNYKWKMRLLLLGMAIAITPILLFLVSKI